MVCDVSQCWGEGCEWVGAVGDRAGSVGDLLVEGVAGVGVVVAGGGAAVVVVEGAAVGGLVAGVVGDGVARVRWTPDFGGDPGGGRPGWVVQRSTRRSSVGRR